ncbi:sensor histidine kinase inhibitor, KipI family [Agromyces sp. CF514]|uniref:5-oxoprolinase subunit B family protein n=1 Tax=Agromyces sp. CF514 TaxID=1881031 RepID=UPI0008F0882E|nr:allophanate hydrolase subunit 1 [Agromyces sp. CF514]SFR84914.1 sensor histidine kinase inhibitor, KipI family [Agromyces sp. CF514]
MTRRLLPSGEAALLVECDSLDEVLALHDALEEARPAGVVELVPAARTLLVAVDPERMPLESAATWVRRIPAEAGSRLAGAHAEVVHIPVSYDGDDLASTAALLDVSIEALVAQHSGIEWRVAFGGFAPGFGYLVSDAWPFEVPRLEAPRARVPAGSVAVAGAFGGVYPRQSPGGWRLLGRTDATLWNPASDDPAALAPGRRVRFESA